MDGMMNKLTKDQFEEMYKGSKNLTNKPIFIDFYADWWGPCKMFEQVLNEVVPEYKDRIQMYKVDIEDEVDLAIQFGARGVPYMVFIPYIILQLQNIINYLHYLGRT